MYDAKSLSELLMTPGKTRDRIGEPSSFGREKRREITTEWKVGPGKNNTEDGEIVLTMASRHHKTSKQYITDVRVEFVGENFRQTVMAFGAEGEAIGVKRTPVERFSAKTMREHHERCRELVRYSADHSGRVLAEGVKRYIPEPVEA